MKYHYTNAQNQPVGPVELAELAGLAAQGIINDQTAVIPEGGQTWTSYGAVRQGATANAAAEAVAAGMGRAATAFKEFSWGSLLFGLLLIFLGLLTLPWTVLTSAARELAGWGRDRALPLRESDAPVLTFYVVVMRNATLVLTAFFAVLFALINLFTGRLPVIGGLMPFVGGDGGWNPIYAFGGFFMSLIWGYFALVGIAFIFESVALVVRIANDVKIIAKR